MDTTIGVECGSEGSGDNDMRSVAKCIVVTRPRTENGLTVAEVRLFMMHSATLHTSQIK